LESPGLVVFKNVTRVRRWIGGQGCDSGYLLCHRRPADIGELITIVDHRLGKSTLLRSIAALKPHFPPTKARSRIGKRSDPGPDRGLVDQNIRFCRIKCWRMLLRLKLRGLALKDGGAHNWVKRCLEGSEDKFLRSCPRNAAASGAGGDADLGPRILLRMNHLARSIRHRLRMQELLMEL